MRRTPIRETIKPLVALSFIILFLAHFMLFVHAFLTARLAGPPATPLFEDRDNEYLTDFQNGDGKYGFWKIEGPVPERIKAAFIAIEDKRFYSHIGCDFRSLLRALLNNISGKPVQGGSTIPMQVARMQNPKKRELLNKLSEIYTAMLLVLKYPREEILRHYLRIVPQGNQMHGVAYAARRYFRKPLSDISWAEAALLTAVIKAPGEMNLYTFDGSLKAAKRARIILEILYSEGHMSGEEYRTALGVLYDKSYQIKECRPEYAYHYLFRLLETYGKKTGENGTQNYSRPVRTSLDREIQQFLDRTAAQCMAQYRPCGAGNIAVIVAETKTGNILGYIGSERYDDKENAGAINYADTPRSSGSTLKPFLYGLGLDTGTFTPASIIPDLPLSILSIKGEYRPGNFDDDYLGPLLYRHALANSRNIPAIRVLDAIGIDRTLGYFSELGLGSGAEHPSDYYGYGLAVGGLYVTLEQLVSAYGMLARDGETFRLCFEYKSREEKGRRLMSVNAARQISLFLSDPLARSPSFKQLSRIGFSYPIAIKTGTSQGYRDAWAVGYNADYIVGIWMGHPKNHRMNHLTGGEAALAVYSVFTFLDPEKKQGIREEPFKKPPDTIPRKICKLSGKCAGSFCTDISIEYFRPGEEPLEYCGFHREFAIDGATGKPAGKTTPVNRVVTQSYAVLPPEYGAWAVKHGYKTPEVAYETLDDASITILDPQNGSSLLIDPETPRACQSIPLRAHVEPLVKEIVWLVDGEAYQVTGFPYSIRWNLEQGTHTIQAKFARAHIYSKKVVIDVDDY
ncbi:MAG: transglycosylase domain-containing protein [Spirochaetales bacterium]|nr:transglycosylase domain-containing protein [Spirochaetales bacterium]